jgi:hypothetical protein
MQPIIPTWNYFHSDVGFYRHRKNKTLIVIGVLTNQVHAPRSDYHKAGILSCLLPPGVCAIVFQRHRVRISGLEKPGAPVEKIQPFQPHRRAFSEEQHARG